MRPTLVFHVTKCSDGWRLGVAGSSKTLQFFARKEDAVRTGLRHAEAVPPSQLLVLDADGGTEFDHSFQTRDPAPTPQQRAGYAFGPGVLPREKL